MMAPGDTMDAVAGRWRLRRLWMILRREGSRGVRFRALALLGWRSYGLYVRALDKPAAAATALPVEIGELRAADAGAYLTLRPGAAAGFLDRLRTGHACFAARHNGWIVAATWVAVDRARMEHLRRDILLAPDEIHLFDSFTAPEHRGRGLFPAIFAVIVAIYRARGYRRAVTFIAFHNRASTRSRERSGFRCIGTARPLPRGPIRTANFVARDHRRQGW